MCVAATRAGVWRAQPTPRNFGGAHGTVHRHADWPRGLATMPEVGIFAQRAKDRPNPLGITVVPLLAVSDEGLVVRGLDAIDGTPVLDVKPYYPHYDRAETPCVPEWVDRLTRDYF
jgi:tRNA (adenine37-N6)-methyltransferase